MTAHSVVKMRLLHVFPIEQDWMQLNSNGAGSFRCLHFCFLKEVRLLSDASCRTMGYFVGIKVALSKGTPEKLSESYASSPLYAVGGSDQICPCELLSCYISSGHISREANSVKDGLTKYGLYLLVQWCLWMFEALPSFCSVQFF